VVVLPTPIEMIGMTDKSKDILPGSRRYYVSASLFLLRIHTHVLAFGDGVSFIGTEADPTKFKFWCCHRGQVKYILIW